MMEFLLGVWVGGAILLLGVLEEEPVDLAACLIITTWPISLSYDLLNRVYGKLRRTE